jgi:hypothetical protein
VVGALRRVSRHPPRQTPSSDGGVERGRYAFAPRAPTSVTSTTSGGQFSRTGITDIGSGRLFIIKPYALLQYDKQTGQNPAFPLTGGLDIKYGIRSNIVLNLTGNTDFSSTDVDQEQFNLTPFPIFIPEKRQFFLENQGYPSLRR